MSTAVQTSSAERRTSRTSSATVSAVFSIHTLQVHSPSRFRDTHVIEPERTPDGTKSAYLWKPVVLRSLRHGEEPWRSHLGARSATPVHVGPAGMLVILRTRDSRSGRETGPAVHRARRSKRARGHVVPLRFRLRFSMER